MQDGRRIIVVTGANSGIGFAATQAFAERGDAVAMVCRSRERGEAAIARIRESTDAGMLQLFIADLSLMSETRRVAKELAESLGPIDVLANNAGVGLGSREVTSEGFERVFACNHLSTWLLTSVLLPHLRADARVVFTSSNAHSHSALDFEDLQVERGYSLIKAYGRSKLMNVLAAQGFHRRHGGTGVRFSSFHPGPVATGLWSKGGTFARVVGTLLRPIMRTPARGADTLVWLADATAPPASAPEGRYFVDRKVAKTGRVASAEAEDRLWDVTRELLQWPDQAGTSDPTS